MESLLSAILGKSSREQVPSVPWTTVLVVGAIATLLLKWILDYRNQINVPGIGYGSIPIPFIQRWRGAIGFTLHPQEYMAEGYRKYKGGMFRISALDKEMVIVADGDKILEYLAAPDDVVNMLESANDSIQTEYTVSKFVAETPFQVPLVRTKLTQHIASSITSIREEIKSSFDDGIGALPDYVEVPLCDVITKTIARVTNRVLCGPELAHDERHLANAIAYTMDVVISALFVRLFPKWFKPLFVMLMPVKRRQALAHEIIGPEVRRRMAASDRGDPDRPDDMLQWLVDSAPPGTRTVENIADMVMFLNFGGIHTTSGTLMAALYQLAQEPEKYIAPLREEVRTVFAGAPDGQVTKQMIAKLEKMDSFLTETGRVFPFGLALMSRTVIKPFRFKDGTYIPAGTALSSPGLPMQLDAQYYDNPEQFDGFRFTRMAKRHYMITTGVETQLFGHGRHACPGRFFAVNEMKLIFADLLLRYDIKLAPGTAPRRTMFGNSFIPETKLKVLMRSAGSQ